MQAGNYSLSFDLPIKEWIGKKSTDPHRRPFAVIMKSTDICNYACHYCYVEKHCALPRMPIETAKMTINKVLAYVNPGRKVNFIWHGGEPLLSGKDFFVEVADFCDTFHENPIENCIQTNGSLLDRDFLSFCRARGFLVSVSIDGPASIHDIHRQTPQGQGTFADTLRALDLVREAGLTPGCVCVLNKANIRHIDELYWFFSTNKINVRINPVVRSGRAIAAYNELAISALEYGQAMCRMFDLWFQDNYVIQIEPLYTILGNFISPVVWGCDYHGRCLESIISVNPDGSIYPCGRFAGLEEFRLGNVLEDSDLQNLFSTDLFRRLTHRSVATVSGCANCAFAEICNAGCMITAYMARQSVSDHDYYCEGRRMLFAHIASQLKTHLDSISVAQQATNR